MFAKKNLVAAAALLAIAGAAQAQVKVYGLVDAGFGSFEAAHAKSGPSTRATKVESGIMTTSFIGFSGSEDLGGGLKAEFALESFLNADTGTTGPNLAGGFWGRTSNIALSGGFGKVALGQYDNPLFTSGYTYNPFGSSMVASPTMRHFYSVTPTLGFDTGWVNSITYESPVVQGFNGVAQFAPKETPSGSANSYTAAGSYNNGPISATLTYVKAGKVAASTAYKADQKVVDLGVSYDLGTAKLFGQYTNVKDTTNQVKDTVYQLGVSVPVNDKVAVLASFGSAKFKPDSGAAATTDKVFSLGADYTLSKRTDVYAAVVNNTQTSLSSGTSVVAGIRTNF